MAELSLQSGEEDIAIRPLPVGSAGRKSSGWFGMMTLIATEASLFLYLLFSYFYIDLWSSGRFLPKQPPSFDLSGPGTVILLLSSVVVWWGEKGARKGSARQLSLGLFGGLLLGAGFVSIQLIEWSKKPYRFNSSSYSSLYFTITGFHLAHVLVGILILLLLLVWSLLGYFDSKRHAPVMIGTIYWHFVDAVWLVVFVTIYVTPYLG